MGPQRILQAVAVVASLAAQPSISAAAPESPRPLRAQERIAVIDLSAAPRATADEVDRTLVAAVAAAGFDPVTGDGVEDALAGRDVDRDAGQLAAAIATAQRAFGELRCNEVVPATRQAIGIGAARQAAGLPAPELARAWIYVLLCADRENHPDLALTAASRLRVLDGERPAEVPANVWSKYPAIDAASDVELVELDIDADVAGAAIWIDGARAGASPLHVVVPAGDHVIAAAAGTRRGWAAGTAVRTQRAVHVPLTEAAGPWSEVAQRVAGWHGALPAPGELAWVLARVHARIAIVRRGDTVSAWGQIGRSEPPHPIAGDGAAPVADVERVLGQIAGRIRTWSDHAPDPDRPLLVDAPEPLAARKDEGEKPTKWWVYAAIAGAAAIGGAILFVHDSGSDRQRVELHYP
jgi:PEGA domain-containing protein